MVQLVDLVNRLQSSGETWLQEQALLDQALCEKVIRAIDTVANPKTVPVLVKRTSVDSTIVEFDFGEFIATTWVSDAPDGRACNTVNLSFKEGVVVRESTNTIPLLHRAILDYLGLETHYQSGNSLKVETFSGKLRVELKCKVQQ